MINKLSFEQLLSIECPGCGARIRTTLGWISTHATLGCTACAAIFDTSMLTKLVAEAKRAADRAGREAPEVIRVKVDL
jgi:hypothetical protein